MNVSPRDDLKRAARVLPCRWAVPDGDGYCQRCGWPTAKIKATATTMGHYRHKRPKRVLLPRPMTAYRVESYPPQARSTLTLSEVLMLREAWSEQRLSQTVIDSTDITEGFRKGRRFKRRVGASNRIISPNKSEWARFKRRNLGVQAR